MKPKRISAASAGLPAGAPAAARAARGSPRGDAGARTLRFVLVTLDAHLGAAVAGAESLLRRDLPSVEFRTHVAADWATDPASVERCRADLRSADIIVVTQLFLEEHVQAVLETITQRRDACDAVMCAVCAPSLARLTRMGRFSMAGGDNENGAAPSPWSAAGLLRKLRGRRTDGRSSGERQMQVLRTLPKLLRFIPGTSQDVRAYLLALQCWLSGSAENVATLVRLLVDRYASGPRAALRGSITVGSPAAYPELGIYHPGLAAPLHVTDDVREVPTAGARGRVGLLVFRSYVLAGNTAHYDAVIRALEARGVGVIAAFASTLDNRPAIARYFQDRLGRPTIDALVSLTGFSLVGGPAYTDAAAAQEVLASLDVPYIAAQTLEFQSIADWVADPRGLSPIQATLQVAIPELDGATAPIVYAGRGHAGETAGGATSQPVADRVALLAGRVARQIALRRKPRGDRKVAIVLFNFPPNAGNTGSAAYLAVFDSLQRTLAALAEDGYAIDLPERVDTLRQRIVEGNAQQWGTPANVYGRVPADVHVRREPHLAEIERTWGPAPGNKLTDGRSLYILGERFGNVFVGVQPSFGWEGDPMRLLFEGNFAPTHAFAAFYRWLEEDFGADVILHFGTHGALEFMPGKQVGLTAQCWPERLIRDMPHVYLYASNNSSEGTLAKRRSAATLVSYLTPPIARSGLYRGLVELKTTLDRYRSSDPRADDERARLVDVMQSQARALELHVGGDVWGDDTASHIESLREQLREIEVALIPVGLHTVGVPPTDLERAETLDAIRDTAPAGTDLARVDAALRSDHEIAGLLRALDGRYVPPAPGGDLVRNPAVVPTGRNVYGFDPYHVPSAFAMREGQRQADVLLTRHLASAGVLPESVAVVLWGTDNMKTEGEPIAQALTLLGAVPRYDSIGRLCGARLLPATGLGRPRIDVVMSLSGVFRDLFPLQVALLAEAAWLAATADEPVEHNFVRKHALAHQAACGCDIETAALRVFSNAEGAYGSNVNLAIDAGEWTEESELAEMFVRRKSVAYGRSGPPVARPELFRRVLAGVDLAYQNLDSVELGATDIDQYVEALGGLVGAVREQRGAAIPAYMSDSTAGRCAVRTLAEQVELETRTRTLNPKWYEGQLRFGYEGVRNIAARASIALGWSATTSAVAPWVYREIAATFVLDPTMRDRLASHNPTAAAGMANRLLEATSRGYWQPDADTMARLRDAADELEDRMEGVIEGKLVAAR